MFVLPKRTYASGRPKELRWGKKQRVQPLSCEETPASIAELPRADFADSTASGKKLTLSLPSISGTCEAGQKLSTKDQLCPP